MKVLKFNDKDRVFKKYDKQINQRVLDYNNSIGYKLPAYMQRGGCIGCYYKSKKEYEAMAS